MQIPCGKVLPCGWALLPGKDEATYTRMWSVIQKEVGPNIKPEQLVMDMEAAAASAFIAIFGEDVFIQYCFFHYRYYTLFYCNVLYYDIL